MAKVVVGKEAPDFVTIDLMKPGQGGFVIDGGTLGDVIIRAKGDYALNLSKGDVLNVSATITVFLIPSGTPVTVETT